ncbi:phosphomethylpyrimidine synthase ThiC [candidate division WOR-3 bacterium]|uniref:Phosphomethylpyrimidine synthase n=1 Tax=candidate division WOR-3 bacterium TaxID=2052148 RepID=A0A938BNK1_UNCW3|nr:phosphomethylpyrimidine synthase ThiC [candidate division WOR-3 bacterium]
MKQASQRPAWLTKVAAQEQVSPELIAKHCAEGKVTILRSRHRRIAPLAVGKGMTVKVNANIGTSPDASDLKNELAKLGAAVAAGADTVMDLSVGGDVDEVRAAVVAESPIPVGTVPVYQTALDARRRGKSFVDASAREMLAGVEKHLRDGVDFVTVHCGITRQNVEILTKARRVCGVVSRGGSMTIEWMRRNRKENPLYEYYDELLAMARDHGAALSIGDGLRPGALADATDTAQVAELLTIGELVARARAAGVQAMVEGPGHVPLDQIEANVKLEKAVCDGAPFYLLGPLVTDVGCGYDHITGAIGGALAAWHGADFLCYVTPSEHLGLPTIEDVRQGVVASRIAAHAADVARHHPGAVLWDLKVSKARAALDWKGMIAGCVDPQRAQAVFSAARSHTEGACTMCGEFCAIRRMAPPGTSPKRARRRGRTRR